jgi:hypothetical protein
MKPKLWTAMATYGVLGALAGFTLDGLIRNAVWIFLGALAVKTWIASARAHLP